MWMKVYIKQFERGLMFRRGDFVRPLRPGTYRIPIWRIGKDCVEVVSTLKTKFEHALLDVLIRDERLREQLAIIDLTDTQRALVWKDGRLFAIVGPGRHAFWKVPAMIAIETFDVGDFRFAHPKLATILQHADATKWLDGVQVDAEQDVLLYRDGVLIEQLGE